MEILDPTNNKQWHQINPNSGTLHSRNNKVDGPTITACKDEEVVEAMVRLGEAHTRTQQNASSTCGIVSLADVMLITTVYIVR